MAMSSLASYSPLPNSSSAAPSVSHVPYNPEGTGRTARPKGSYQPGMFAGVRCS